MIKESREGKYSERSKKTRKYSAEEQLIAEITDIDKKLHSKSFAKKPFEVIEEEKYFSEECSDLFEQELCAQFRENAKGSSVVNDQLLFESYEQGMEPSQVRFYKEVKAFKQFDTNQLSEISHSSKKTINSKQTNQQSHCHSQKIIKAPRRKNIYGDFGGQIQNSKKYIPQQSSVQGECNKENQTNEINLKAQSFRKVNRRSKLHNQTQESSAVPQGLLLSDYQSEDEDSLDFRDKFNSKQSKISSVSRRQRPNKHKCMTQSSEHESLQCTFRPAILKRSEAIAEHLQPSFTRLTENSHSSREKLGRLPYRPHPQSEQNSQETASKKYSQQRISRLSKPRAVKLPEEEDLPEKKYSFKPKLSKQSLRQMSNCSLDVASRNKLWLQEREAKVLRLKVEEQQAQLRRESSSFKPQINNYRGETKVHLSRFAKQGMQSHFQRLSNAKQQRRSVVKSTREEYTDPIRDTVMHRKGSNQGSGHVNKKTYDEAVKDLHKKIMAMDL